MIKLSLTSAAGKLDTQQSESQMLARWLKTPASTDYWTVYGTYIKELDGDMDRKVPRSASGTAL
jgi:hypothetical protein